MNKDIKDIILDICSEDKNSPGIIDVIDKKPEHRALSILALENGCRDIIYLAEARRFILSPFDFREIFDHSESHSLVSFPKFFGKGSFKNENCYIFEIPLSSISFELVPDWKRVVESAKGTGSPFELLPDILETTKKKNPDLPQELFDNPSHYWANNTEGQFILIFPFTASDRSS